MDIQKISKFAVMSLAVVAFAATGCKKKGCTDPEAQNYNPDAKKDDGSCIAHVDGCTNPSAVNYNSAATKDDGSCAVVDSKQRSLSVKFTATWCFACGDYGGSVFKDIGDANSSDDLIRIACHKSGDDMHNQVAADWQTVMGSGSTPCFAVNGNLISGHPLSPTNSAVTSTNAQSAEVGLAISHTVSGDNIIITGAYSVLQNISGEYYLGLYVLDNGTDERQKGDDGSFSPAGSTWNASTAYYDNYIHDHVLRGGGFLSGGDNGASWGTKIVDGSGSTGQASNFDVTIPIVSGNSSAADWSGNYEVHAVVWKKNGTSWDYVNAR